MTLPETFGKNLPTWREWQRAPWGRLFYRVEQANLLRHLGPASLNVLDVGGGNGIDAGFLAGLGHAVTLVDYAAPMLAEARAAAGASGVLDRVSFAQATVDDLPALFAPASFDAVLFHNVLGYVENVVASLEAIAGTLKPGGLVSVVGANRYSDPYRAAIRRLNLVEAYEQLEATAELTGVFGAHRRKLSANETIAWLQLAGLETIAQYGIRCICDYIPNDEIKSDPEIYAQLESLELAMTDQFPYYLVARFFQVVARKGAAG